MNAPKIIYGLLSESIELDNLLGASGVAAEHKVFRIIAPQDELLPFVTYTQIGENPDHCAQRLAVRTPSIQINVWGNTPDQVDEIAELIIELLDGQVGPYRSGDDAFHFDNILFANNTEIFSPNLDPVAFGRALDFQIRIPQ